MIKVLLVDDHELVRACIRLLLQDIENIEVVGEAKSGEEALGATKELKPDVVLLDLNMPGMGGFEAITRLLRIKPSPKILILSAHVEPLVPLRLLKLGAAGYLSKRANQQQMVAAIETVYTGERYIDPQMTDPIASFQMTLQSNPPLLSQLTERELQIIIMLANGLERGEIANSLFLSKKTVDGYLLGAFKKLGVKMEAEAVRMAIQSGLIDTDE